MDHVAAPCSAGRQKSRRAGDRRTRGAPAKRCLVLARSMINVALLRRLKLAFKPAGDFAGLERVKPLTL